MTKKLRVGLIGSGGIAQSHMRGWEENENAEVVAICDIKREEAAEKLPAAFQTLDRAA